MRSPIQLSDFYSLSDSLCWPCKNTLSQGIIDKMRDRWESHPNVESTEENWISNLNDKIHCFASFCWVCLHCAVQRCINNIHIHVQKKQFIWILHLSDEMAIYSTQSMVNVQCVDAPSANINNLSLYSIKQRL